MATIYLVILIALVAVPLGMTLTRPTRIFEYPFFMAFAFAVFILPQAFSLIRFPGAVEDSSVDAVLLMSLLCMAACFVGYRWTAGSIMMRWATHSVDLRRLFHVGVLFIAVGYAMSRALSVVDVQYSEAGGMTGTATIVLFFGQLAYPGFAIVFFCALRRPSFTTIAASIFGLIPLLLSAAYGRREGTAMLVLTVAMALFYERRMQPSRLAIVGLLVFSMLAIPATYRYRGYANDNNWAGVRDIDLVEEFKHFVFEESILELRNGAAIIESTRKTGNYELGAAYWNHMVFRFVPAQLTAVGFKQSLMLNSFDVTKHSGSEMGIPFSIGSTITGMGDTFLQFGWSGCLFFAFMGGIFKGMWKASLSNDALFARLLYALSITSGMRAVTHWTLDFLPGLIYYAIFLGAALLYAGAPRRRLSGKGSGLPRFGAALGGGGGKINCRRGYVPHVIVRRGGASVQ